MRLDLLLASLPPNYLNEPSIAPAILKSAAETNGFSCRTIDFSLHCFKTIFNRQYSTYLEWINILPDHSDFSTVTDHQKELLDSVVNEFMGLIIKYNPRFVGLSIFSIWQQRFGYFLCKKIKESRIDTQIILGGMGCGKIPTGLNTVTSLSYFDKKNSYANFMINKKLTDFVIINDGEIELVNILNNSNKYQNSLNSNEVIFDYNYYPNFDDYELDEYLFTNGEKKLLVQGSKGCVRQCVFCSEHGNYSKFYFKSGTALANEIISLSIKHKIFKFHLTDSLVNGSIREFKNFVKTLAQYNSDNPSSQIKWHGNYICRAENRMVDEDFRLIKMSGGHGLTIGAESGSKRVLKEMKKNTTAEDLIYEVSKFSEHGIDCTLLFMVGFYNEMWEDFLLTLQLFKVLHKYFFTGTISSIRLGNTLAVSDNLEYPYEDFIHDPTNVFNWIYLKNPSLTLAERIRRRVIAQEFCDELGIPIAYSREDLLVTDAIYNNNLLEIERLTSGDH